MIVMLEQLEHLGTLAAYSYTRPALTLTDQCYILTDRHRNN